MITQTGYPSIDKPWMKFYSPKCKEIDIPKCSLYENIWNNNKEHLSDIALHYFGTKITYGRLFDMIRIAEGRARKLDIKSGDKIGFISLYTPEMIALFYALNKLGAVCCMMDPRTAPENLSKYIKSADVKCLFIQDACIDITDKVLSIIEIKKAVVLSTCASMEFPKKQLIYMKMRKKYSQRYIRFEKIDYEKIIDAETKPTDVGRQPAVVCYTGGTTGESKGVLLSNENINSVVEQFRAPTGGFERQQKWLSPAVPFVAYFLICSLHMPLAFGMQCYIQLYDNERMIKAVSKYKINHLAATPFFYEKLFKNREKDFSYIIMPTTGGDKLSEKTYNTINEYLEAGNCSWKICNGYGMTEVSSGACISFNGKSNKANSVGIPLINTIVTAFDTGNGEELRQGQQGEICISSPCVMLEYLGNKAATDEVIRFHHGRRWMHTGDIGYIDENGCVFIVGRLKRMIVRFDGFKIFPSLVEEKILTCPLVSDCSCVAMKDKEHEVGEVAVIFYTTKDKNAVAENIENELRKISEQFLPKYSQPSAYHMIDELPYTHAGKVDYRKLEGMLIKENV